jgi:hypothetical protein
MKRVPELRDKFHAYVLIFNKLIMLFTYEIAIRKIFTPTENDDVAIPCDH